MARARYWFGVLGCILALSCGVPLEGDSGANGAQADKPKGEVNVARHKARNFVTNPLFVDLSDVQVLYAVSDAHGYLSIFQELLRGAGVTDMDNRWKVGKAVLVIAGDMIDKGPDSLGVLQFVHNLQEQAKDAGGQVVALMGNHEAEFLADPTNSKAKGSVSAEDVEKAKKKGDKELKKLEESEGIGIDLQLAQKGVNPYDVANGEDMLGVNSKGEKFSIGQWLMNLPMGVRVNSTGKDGHTGWFFSHAGNTRDRKEKDKDERALSFADLEAYYEEGLKKHGFASGRIIGDDSHSILEDRKWYGDPSKDSCGVRETDALHVVHIAFGHDPDALDARGKIAASKNKRIVKIDCQMGREFGDDTSHGKMMRVTFAGARDAEVVVLKRKPGSNVQPHNVFKD
jgi:hypothetical protein